jgi:hypothetical protein
VLASNSITSLPDLLDYHQLELDMSFNLLKSLTQNIFLLKDFDATGNPLVDILPAYRGDKDKVYFLYQL